MAEVILLCVTRPLFAGTHMLLTKALSDVARSAVEKETEVTFV